MRVWTLSRGMFGKDSLKLFPSLVNFGMSKLDQYELCFFYRVGSCLKPFGIACFDEYDNQIKFTSVPTLEVELKANSGFQLKIDDFEANLIDGGSTLMIKVYIPHG